MTVAPVTTDQTDPAAMRHDQKTDLEGRVLTWSDCLVYPVPDVGRAHMQLHLGLTGLALLLLASGLTACAAQPSGQCRAIGRAYFNQLLCHRLRRLRPTTLSPATPTRTPSPTLTPTQTATTTADRDGSTLRRLNRLPSLTPIPIVPPAPDGVVRTADVPILMYHYISAAPSAQDRIRYGLSVPPEMFEAQLKLLRDNGFTTISLRDLYEYLAIGKPLPEQARSFSRLMTATSTTTPMRFRSCRSTA